MATEEFKTDVEKREAWLEYLKYLDELRDSGVTNMFGAGAFLEREFDMDKASARKVLVYWMQTFKDRNTPGGAD